MMGINAISLTYDKLEPMYKEGLKDIPLASLNDQLQTWKSIFHTLMNHEASIRNELKPERIPLVRLPAYVAEEYETKLKQFYIFVRQYLETDEQSKLWVSFFEEDMAAVKNLSMTHESFIFSTFRLSILMDRKSILANTIVEPELKELITSGNWNNIQFYHDTFASRVFRFPDPPMSLVAPIFLQEGEIPIHNFLEAFLLEDFPYGLAAIPLDPTYVHGGTMAAPGLFYSHDLLHWPVFVRLVNRHPDRWARLRKSLRELYIRNSLRDPVLDYFIFMILHEGALNDEYGQGEESRDLKQDIQFLIEQIYEEMKNRFDYHRSFLKNFFLAKLQNVLSKPFKLYAVDEIDEQRLDVIDYERVTPNCYSARAALMAQNKKVMEVNCTITVKPTEDIFFSLCSIKDISVSFISPEMFEQKDDILQKLLGEVLIKNARYFFYIDVKDHLKVFRKLTDFPSDQDAYPAFLPWVREQVERLIYEYTS